MNIAIASGKGGTGKTTVAVSLAAFCADKGLTVSLLDCDVEEPNVNLFLKSPIQKETQVFTLIPSVNDDLCTGCGECETICEFSSIVLIKGKPLVLPDMCHSCGGCFHACQEKAITEIKKNIGTIETGMKNGINYSGGKLNIGEPMAPPLIKELKKIDNLVSDIRIFDCPPGTSCPVIESVRGCDFLALVTEPTPFGLNDLKLAVDMARALNIRFGVIINKAGSGDDRVDIFCKQENIKVLARIPFTREIASGYSKGEFISHMLARYSLIFNDIHSIAGRDLINA